jgi:hypothetical protein
MNKIPLLKWEMKAGLVLVALLALAGSAPAALVVATTNQTGILPFTPRLDPRFKQSDCRAGSQQFGG